MRPVRRNLSPSVETLWSRRSDLSAEGLALTGMVMLRTGDNRSAQIAQILEGKVKREGVLASWPSKYNPLLDLNDDNSAESTAFALRFLTHADSEESLAGRGRAVAGGQSHRRLLVELDRTDSHGAFWSGRLSCRLAGAERGLRRRRIGQWQWDRQASFHCRGCGLGR